MDILLILKALILGVVEAASEFLPISSTGHLIIVGDFLAFTGPRAEAFQIFIQLGAILAVVWIYRERLLDIAINVDWDPKAQRLVRKICPYCREAYVPPDTFLERVGLSPIKFAGKELYRGVGCAQCLQTGYKGRIGIFELMSLTPAMKSLILTTSDAGQIKKQALSSLATGMMTLRQDGLRKVLAGLTTLEEVFRVT